MGSILALLAALIPKLAEGIAALWEKFGEKLVLRWDATRDQKLRDQKATLEAIVKAQREVHVGKAALEDERSKTPDRLTKGWWERGAKVLVLGTGITLLSGCALLQGMQAKPPLPVAPVRVMMSRPAFAGLSEVQTAWLNALIMAYEENCVALSITGGKPPLDAVRACVIK